MTKTIVEETIIKADGSKTTTTRETVSTGGSADKSGGKVSIQCICFSSMFRRINIADKKALDYVEMLSVI